MEFVPLLAGDRQVIESYGANGFRVSGVLHTGAILVLPRSTQSLAITHIGELSAALLQPLFDAAVEILLLGCGSRMSPVPLALRQELRAHGVVIEPMGSGAACRTYNLLAAEDRRVAAALLPLH
jgi:uncharacterized protein